MSTNSASSDARFHETQRLLKLLVTDLDEGFEALVRSHQRIVYSTVLRACAHPVDAEDLAAQTFLRAYTALLGYDETRIMALQPRPWLVTIALNIWRNAVRDSTRQPSQVPLERAAHLPVNGATVEQVAEHHEDRRHLAPMVARLPENQRVAVVLRYVCEFSIAEIADILRCPTATVRSHIFRGLQRLRNEYSPAELSAVPAVAPPPPIDLRVAAGKRKEAAR